MDRSLAPQSVSPLIKFSPPPPVPFKTKSCVFPSGARWSLLIAGIFYGNARYRRLYHKEQLKREEFERTRPEREAKQKAQKEKELKEQIEDLSKQLGQSI